ncbi:DNA-binding transcriptional LysR family regulator [Brevibacterium sanguinis]|uniref:DNA-binding transcriptional LysR family regulator n=2 Tax=Brevibacterium TaxID=1696 RepID=A0A366IHB4_9MICO|nr:MULTISPECIES: LysR family transcriptional regulator [Brevibacterium]RBP64948.1 DNA-binding transcriptional LysR family regulator [Brevibacterium sanguinis]RBP71211.1 DNA-binding transcriptional LysR family regulator [Brevibacterium celere]
MNGVNYTFDQLRSFLVLSEELNFGRAAKVLSITQPPLTRQIRKLERSLGFDLFVRHRNGVELTRAGLEFREGAYRIFTAARAAQDSAAAQAKATEVTVRVGFTGLGAVMVLPTLLSRLARTHPRIRITVVEAVSPEQYDLLDRGELDLGVVRPLGSTAGIDLHRMSAEPLVVALPAGRGPEGTGPISPGDLRGLAMIAFDRKRSPLLARFTDDWADRYQLEVSAKVSQVLPGVALAASGLGFSVAPASVMSMDFAGVDYRRIVTTPDTEPPVLPLAVAEAKEGGNPAAADVRRVLVEIGREFDER